MRLIANDDRPSNGFYHRETILIKTIYLKLFQYEMCVLFCHTYKIGKWVSEQQKN